MKIQVSLKSLRNLVPFCSNEEQSFVLNGIRIIDKQIDDKFFRIYEATDGRILGRIIREIKGIELEKEIVLFANDIKKIDKKIKIDIIDCEIFKNKGEIYYRAEISNTIIEIIDGKYPNTENLMPYSLTYSDKWKKNDIFFYIRAKYMVMIEEFFHGGKLKVNDNWNGINGVMGNQMIKEKSTMLSYCSLDNEQAKFVIVIPVSV